MDPHPARPLIATGSHTGGPPVARDRSLIPPDPDLGQRFVTINLTREELQQMRATLAAADLAGTPSPYEGLEDYVDDSLTTIIHSDTLAVTISAYGLGSFSDPTQDDGAPGTSGYDELHANAPGLQSVNVMLHGLAVRANDEGVPYDGDRPLPRTADLIHAGAEPAQPPSPGALDPTAPPTDRPHTPIPVPTMTAPPAGACGPQSTGTIEFADVLTLNGRTYHALAPDRGPTAVTVGALHTTTSCRLADGAPLDGEPTPDRAAAYLAVGTPIHEVNDHDPAFRVVALSGQDMVVYQALEATAAGHPLAALGAVRMDFVAQGTPQSVGSPSVRADELITALHEGGPVSPAQDRLLCSDRVNLSVTLTDGSIVSVIVYPAAGAAVLHPAAEYLPLAPAIIETLVAEAPAEAISSGSFACD